MHLRDVAAREPRRCAVLLGERHVNYGALDSASRRLASWARGRGLVRGDVLAVLAHNGPEFLAAVAAAQRCGLYALPLSPRFVPGELAYILEDSGARLLLHDGACAASAAAAAQRLPGLECAQLDRWPELFDESGAPADPDPVEGGDMLYTSGTTGRPKGVRRPLALGPLGSESSRTQRLQALFAMDADTVFLSPAPLYHAAPLRFTMALLRVGARIVLMPRFDAAQALRLLHEEAITHSQWVPTMFSRLLAENEERPVDRAPAHRVAIHAGAPCPESLKRRMIAWWGPLLHEYYSGTESVGFTHINSEDWLRHPGSVGRPWNCEVHILGDEGQPLAPGEVGGVYFSGRGAPAYHKAPDKARDALSPQGYATMGDLGYVDDDGFLYLTDRRAFTIVSGGVNIYPREIEDVLQADARVAGAAVFGTPDDDLVEAVTAVVELRGGTAATPATARALRDALRTNLAGFKLPRTMAFVDSLPLTDSGKVHKARLRDEWRTMAALIVDHSVLTGEAVCATS